MKSRKTKRRLYRGIINKARDMFQVECCLLYGGELVERNTRRMSALESLNAFFANNRAAEAAAQASKTRRKQK